MFRSVILLFSLLCVANCLSVGSTGDAAASETSPINELSLPFYHHLDDKSKNNAYSPLSMAIALSMVRDAAVGQPKTTLDSFFKNRDVSEATTKVLTSNAPTDNVKLNTANLVLAKNDLTIKDSYRQRLLSAYKAIIEPVDYSKKAEVLARANDFVKNNTMGLIPKMLDDLPSGSILTLLNAVSLDAKWEQPFAAHKNFNDTFFGRNGEKLVTFMTKTKLTQYHHCGGLKLAIAELKYSDSLSMFVVVPDEKNGLDSVVASLNDTKLEELIEKTESKHVKLQLPKFEITARYDILPILKKLGLSVVVDSSDSLANAIEISANTKIGSAIHQCVIKVDEEGTKAAAATAVTFVLTSAFIGDETLLKVDRPFMFFIRDNHNKANLFVGTVNEIQP
jgi:serpin B